jgi:ATP-dependent helicase/nuclease subunit A
MSFPVDPATRARQLAASDPARSAWVSANAGSGKTYVLAQRVIRLLHAGVNPSRILCLTFTKAAAANMAERVFDRLRSWTRLDDADLARAIEETTGGRPNPAQLERARTLFARTIETPGGLKVQTIHAFCEKLLHQFPFEANAPAQFRVAEGLQESEMLRLAVRDAMERAAHGDAPLQRAVGRLSVALGRDGLRKLLREAAGRRDEIAALLAEFGSAERYAEAVAREIGIAPDEDPRRCDAELVEGAGGLEGMRALAAATLEANGRPSEVSDLLFAAVAAEPERRAEIWRAAFLAKDGPRKRLLLKAGATARPDLVERLEAEQARVAALAERRKGALLVERTADLARLADVILTRYAERKAQAGLLDFHDLIAKTERLLKGAPSAWIMWKLDQGVDHILVDEAQDTSPAQWSILLSLADEFFSGAGRGGERARTFFAVGDEKQSIFSFQGAAPRLFGETRRDLARRFAAMDRADSFREVELKLSFRSAKAVLEAVDHVFLAPERRRGLSSDDVSPTHESWKSELPGLFEIWPTIAPQEEPAPDDWSPTAARAAEAPEARLADRVAAYVAGLLAPDSPERVHDEDRRPRPVRPSDVMILVRSRGAIFEAVIRALKARGLPTAGADRIRLAEHLAVKDLLAAARAALLSADDLTLAAALKSPLAGLDDDDLVALALDRRGSLAAALTHARAPRLKDAAALVARWREDARVLSPFAFFSALLGERGGRRAFLERLGPEAGDVLDEFMALALEHEQTAAVSLPRFVEAIESGEIEIKREGEAAELVRVMTAHAAKGLEAKIVILPDTCGKPFEPTHQPRLHRSPRAAAPDGATPLLIVAGASADDPAAAVEAKRLFREAAEDEHRRLLYVALTRAEERLIVAGAHGKKAPPADCWRAIVADALEAEGRLVAAPAFWDESETILRRAVGDAARSPAPEPAPVPDVPTPEWLLRPAAPERGPAFLSPSASAPTIAGEAGRRARLRGRRLHEIVEGLAALPPEARRRAAEALPPAEGDLGAAALRLIEDPRLQKLFGPGSRAEVGVRAALPSGEIVAGRVDRLHVGPEEILIGDVKSGGSAEAERHAPQMRLYKAALEAIHPGRRVRMLLLFAGDGAAVEIDAKP